MSHCVCLDSEMPFCSHTGIFTSVHSPGATVEEKKLVPSYEAPVTPVKFMCLPPPSKVAVALLGIQMFLISTCLMEKSENKSCLFNDKIAPILQKRVCVRFHY